MQYGAFGGMSPYAMVADGASVRATSVPAFDLTAANPQYHPVGLPHRKGAPCSSVHHLLTSTVTLQSTLGFARTMSSTEGSERHVCCGLRKHCMENYLQGFMHHATIGSQHPLTLARSR